MSSSDPVSHQRNGCLSLGRLFILLLGCIAIVTVLIHRPIDFFKLFEYVLLVASFFIVLSPWAKLEQYPFLGIVPFLVMAFIVVYPFIVQRPINFFAIFVVLASYTFFLFIFIPRLRIVLRYAPFILFIPIFLLVGLQIYLLIMHRVNVFSFFVTISLPFIVLLVFILNPWVRRRNRPLENAGRKDWRWSLGKTSVLQDLASSTEKPAIHTHLLGISLKVFRLGKYIAIIISSE